MTVTRRDATAPPARSIIKTNLLYFGQQDPICLPAGAPATAPDRELYIVWIRPRPDLFPDEGRARLALHVNHVNHRER